jgi:hypothetical protein
VKPLAFDVQFLADDDDGSQIRFYMNGKTSTFSIVKVKDEWACIVVSGKGLKKPNRKDASRAKGRNG